MTEFQIRRRNPQDGVVESIQCELQLKHLAAAGPGSVDDPQAGRGHPKEIVSVLPGGKRSHQYLSASSVRVPAFAIVTAELELDATAIGDTMALNKALFFESDYQIADLPMSTVRAERLRTG